MTPRLLASAAIFAFATAGAAQAQDNYVSLSAGLSLLGDSDNAGAFDGAFTTGAGTTIPGGTVLPDGTPVGWTTQFDTGYAISGAAGHRYGPFRGELELTWQRNAVDTHVDVSAAGIALGTEDAGVLVTGAPNLGVSVADLVAAAEGNVRTIFVMANIYYDIDTGGPLKPYIGAGAGIGFVNVNYAPSATTIIDDSATPFAYQGMAGVSYDVSPAASLFAGYRYRATLDPKVEATLFSADFEVENRASIIEAGVRFNF